jgi:hypothetical protein
LPGEQRAAEGSPAGAVRALGNATIVRPWCGVKRKHGKKKQERRREQQKTETKKRRQKNEREAEETKM